MTCRIACAIIKECIVSLRRKKADDILLSKKQEENFMKSVSKKLLSLVLAALMIISCAAVAYAADEDFYYRAKSDGTYAVSSYNGEIGEDGVFTLPVKHPKYGAAYTSVDEDAFRYAAGVPELAYLENVKSIVIPANIKLIETLAFANLPALEKVTFEGDITLGEYAFAYCDSLTEVIFKGDVTLKEYAFYDCYSLDTITLDEDAKLDVMRSSLEYTKWYNECGSRKNPDYVMLGTTLVAYKGTDTEVTLPLNVTAIGGGAFAYNDSVKKVIVTKYVDTIGDGAFKYCTSLADVEFSDLGEVTEVGADAFVGTPYFEDYAGEFFIIGKILVKYKSDSEKAHVRIPNTVTSIADNAFLGNYVTSAEGGYTYVVSSITVPVSVKEFGENCFALAELQEGEDGEGTYYVPRIYAYAGSDALEKLKKDGYLVDECYNLGDVDNDGVVDVADARLALRIAVKIDLPTDLSQCAADVDGDGLVTVGDARYILRISVGLENYTAKDLLLMPGTEFEILHAYKNALKTVAKYNAGYTKTYSSTTTGDINKQHEKRILGLVNLNATNKTETFEADTQAALDNIDFCSLADTSAIKVASCAVDENDNYVIAIVLNDFDDAKLTVDSSAYIEKDNYIADIMPIVSGTAFYNAFNDSKDGFGNRWFRKWVADDDTLTTPCVRKYSLDYVEPTVKVTVDRETLKLSSVEMSVNYKFAIDGRMDGVDISGKGFKVGDATFSRVDTVKYSDFTF